MKTILFDNPREFINFKTLANRIQLIFMYKVLHGVFYVEADALRLDELGY